MNTFYRGAILKILKFWFYHHLLHRGGKFSPEYMTPALKLHGRWGNVLTKKPTL